MFVNSLRIARVLRPALRFKLFSKKSQSEIAKSEMDKFRLILKARDLDSALQWTEQNRANIQPRDLINVIGLCNKVEHLPIAHRLVDALKTLDRSPKESVYLSLIRCNSDGFKFETALSLLDEMNAVRLTPKHRQLQPILEGACQNRNLNAVLETLERSIKYDIPAVPDQVKAVLYFMMTTDDWKRLPESGDRINSWLKNASELVMNLAADDLYALSAAAEGVDSAVVKGRGVLVASTETMNHPILDSSTLTETGTVTSVTYRHHENATVEEITQKYRVRDRLAAATDAAHRDVAFPKAIELVDISSMTCRCPNCEEKFSRHSMTRDEMMKVVDALFSLAAASPVSKRSLDEFHSWLQEREEFDYIIDGANVAYYRQNFGNGKFSFEQLELMVDKVRSMGKRALVILPLAYSNTVIPNRAKTGVNYRIVQSMDEEELAILARLRKHDIVYFVPNGSDDDWFWTFAAMYPSRKSPAHVITNDFMRDHKVTFIQPRPFMRWLRSHVIRFYTKYNIFKGKVEVFLHDPGCI